MKGATTYTEANRRAARVILAHPERYAGLMLTWAEMVLGRHGGQQQDAGAGEQMALAFEASEQQEARQ